MTSHLPLLGCVDILQDAPVVVVVGYSQAEPLAEQRTHNHTLINDHMVCVNWTFKILRLQSASVVVFSQCDKALLKDDYSRKLDIP